MDIPIPIVDHYQYPTLNQITRPDGIRHYGCPNGDMLPSVTTILGATKNNPGLEAWIKAVGVKKAEQIRDEAAGIGTVMHRNLEDYLEGKPRRTGTNLANRTGAILADNVIEKGLCHVSEIWGIEKQLYFPGLYAGTADLIGIFKGRPAIMDFKNSRKLKTRDMIGDYFCQLSSYALAHNHLFDTDINLGVIFMCIRDIKDEHIMKEAVSRDRDFVIFEVEGDDFRSSQVEFLERVQTYHDSVG